MAQDISSSADTEQQAGIKEISATVIRGHYQDQEHWYHGPHRCRQNNHHRENAFLFRVHTVLR